MDILTSTLSFIFISMSIILPTLLFVGYWLLRNRSNSKKHAKKFFYEFHIGGHRGSPTMEPENTIASMIQARKEGADLIEFDVSLTKDGVAVILHDDTLDRTTNLNGPIRDFLYKDLGHVDCAAKFTKNRESGITVLPLPTLIELIKWAKEHHMKMLFDIKDADDYFLKRLVELFDEYDLYETSIVCSFFPIIVYKVKRLNSAILTGLTWRRYFVSYIDHEGKNPRFAGYKHYIGLIVDTLNVWSIKTWLPSFLGVDMVLTERSEISSMFVHQQRRKDRVVCAWTVNDINEMMWMRKTLDIPVLTDMPFLTKTIKQVPASEGF
jgi:glycerophosphoryl diester phosphodiesterase